MNKSEMSIQTICYTNGRFDNYSNIRQVMTCFIFLISTDEGNIYVYKYVQSGKVENQKRLIHTYSGHNKNITHLDKIAQFPHLFMSASLDGTARVWSLETFMPLYTIEIPGTLTFANILSRCSHIIAQAHEEVKVHKIHMILDLDIYVAKNWG